MAQSKTNVALRVVAVAGPVDPNFLQEETIDPATGGLNVALVGGAVGGSSVAQGNPNAGGDDAWPTVQRGPVAPAIWITPAHALPATGVWTSTVPTPAAAVAIPPGAKALSFVATFTGGGSDGQLQYRLLVGHSATIPSMVTALKITDGSVDLSAPPDGVQVIYDYVGRRPVSGAATVHIGDSFDVNGGWSHAFLDFADLGVATGTLGVTIAWSF